MNAKAFLNSNNQPSAKEFLGKQKETAMGFLRGDQEEEHKSGTLKSTAKAAHRIGRALIGSIGMSPIAGYEALSKIISTDPSAPLLDFFKAANIINERMAPYSKILKTPEERKSMELIEKYGNWAPRKAGRGAGAITELIATRDMQKAADVARGESSGSTIVVPGAMAVGELSGYSLYGGTRGRGIKTPKVPKGVLKARQARITSLEKLRSEPARPLKQLVKKEQGLAATRPKLDSATITPNDFLVLPRGPEPLPIIKAPLPRIEVLLGKTKKPYRRQQKLDEVRSAIYLDQYPLPKVPKSPKPHPLERHIQRFKSESGGIDIELTGLDKVTALKQKKAINKSPSWRKVQDMVGKESSIFSLPGFFTKVNKALFDRFTPIKKVSTRTYNESRIFSSYKDAAAIKFGELKQSLRPVYNHEQLFTDYVSAHRAKIRARRELKNPNDVTFQDAKTAIQDIERFWIEQGKPLAELRGSLNDFHKWTDTYILQEGIDSGVISRAGAEAIRKNNDFYATFNILDKMPADISGANLVSGTEFFSVANQGVIKKMIGTEKKMANPVEATIKKFTQAQALYARNRVANILIDDTIFTNLIRPVAISKKQFGILKNQGKNPVMEGSWRQKDFGTINRFKDGRAEKYIAPIELAEAMKSLNAHQAGKVITAFNTIFRKTATTAYLPFTISNIMRDSFMAYNTAPVYRWYNPHKFVKDWTKGFYEGAKHEFLGNSKLTTEYLKSGGGFGWTGEVRNVARARQELFKRGMVKSSADIITSPIALMEKISSAAELGPRLGIYSRAKIRNIPNADAALMARQSTIDFSRGGTLLKVLNQYIPFLNAKVQGRVTLFNAMKNNPGQTAGKMFVSTIIPGAAAYAWNRLYFSDYYDDIPEYIKQNYFVIITHTTMNDKGKTVPHYVVISKGDIGQIAWNPIEFGLDEMLEKDNDSTIAFLVNYLSDISPIEFSREGEVSLSKAAGGLLPPIVKGFAEDWANLNMYRGTDVVPYYMGKSLPPELQYHEWTPEMYKWLGDKLKMSPLRIQNFASNILAGYGREGLDPQAMLRGLTGRLVKTTSGAKENKVWSIIKDIEQGYLYTRAYSDQMIGSGNRQEAIQLMRTWNKGLTEQIKQIEQYGFKDRGGIKQSYYFTPDKMKNVLMHNHDDLLTPIERRLRR